MAEAQVRVVTRGDDSGSSSSANRAVRDAFSEGILRNTSLMVPGPAFEEAAEMLRQLPGICVGLHATLTDEWHQSRWGPVLDPSKVSSLVMDDGTFCRDTVELWNRGPQNDEILAELKAQLDRARSRGLDIKYMDVHMGFDWFPGLRPRMAAFAQAEGLIFAPPNLVRLPEPKGDFADPVDRMLAALAAAQPGKTYLKVTHPAYDTPEMQAMTYGNRAPGEIARQRDADRRMLMDPRVVEFCRTHNVLPIRYTEIGSG